MLDLADQQAPALPHTCADCGAHFKQGEAEGLREHLDLCRTYMHRVPVYAAGEAPPPRRFSDESRQSQGYPAPGDRADIWRLWVENGRRGAAELIARYGATPSESAEPAPLRMLGAPDPAKLARHIELYGPECAEPWAGRLDDSARTVHRVVRRRSRRTSRRRMVTRA